TRKRRLIWFVSIVSTFDMWLCFTRVPSCCVCGICCLVVMIVVVVVRFPCSAASVIPRCFLPFPPLFPSRPRPLPLSRARARRISRAPPDGPLQGPLTLDLPAPEALDRWGGPAMQTPRAEPVRTDLCCRRRTPTGGFFVRFP
ncbi:unnamed protein product, partial [Prorocentrum cordatum]